MRRVFIAVVLALTGLLCVAVADQEPPIVLRLGPVVPTPAPSPEPAERIRLITSFTVQNKPDGQSIISFEASEFAELENKNFRTLAASQYSLLEAKKELLPLRDEIVRKIRDLEKDILAYVEKAGPPKAREPVTGGARPQQPYR
jgi:hypothetical protein